MVKLKRIKNKEDLLDVLAYLVEDISTFKFIDNYKDVSNAIAKARDMVGE
jgi:hypothetical protein